jgi:hypothetical protein
MKTRLSILFRSKRKLILYLMDNACILYLSCNINKSKTPAKLSENN